MRLGHKLKRYVALGLRWFAGGWRNRPNAGARRVAPVVQSNLREVAHLAWPIATAMLGETLMGLVDTKLVGGLGAAALGGVGLATMLMYLNYAVVFGLMRGVKVRTAHAVGEGRGADALRYAQAGVMSGFVLGVGVYFFGRDASWALRALHVDPATIPYARDFLAARTCGAPAICMISALVQSRQGRGDTRTPMVIGLAGNVVNAALAYALIYGRWGFPALGVRGAGYATATVEALCASAYLVLLARDAKRDKPSISLGRALREVCDLGVPTGVHLGLETLAFTAFTALLGSMGAEQIAAHQVAMAVVRVSFLPGLALSEAASVLVGRALGARRLDDADRVTRGAIVLAVTYMTFCGVVFAVAGPWIGRGFTHDPSVVHVVRQLLLVAALFQALDAVTMVLRGALRGAKDVRMVMLIGTSVAWVCVPGAAFVLGRLAGLGALGGWCGFVLETGASAVLFWRRWNRGSWRAAYGSTPVEPTPVPSAALASA